MKDRLGMFDIRGRNAFVAGACGYIGRAICHALALQGANVVVADLHADDCKTLVQELEQKASAHQHHLVAIGDLTQEAGIQCALRECTVHGPLNIVVHCLGIISSVPLTGYAVPFAEQTLQAWDLALKTNLTSAFLLSKNIHDHFEKDGCNSVIFLSSIYGSCAPNWSVYEGTTMGNPLAYGASKGGLEQLMRYLATQWAPYVRVNCVSPGGIERGQSPEFIHRYEQLTPFKRMANPEDISGPVVFLASDASRYITGQNLLVDGGWSAW